MKRPILAGLAGATMLLVAVPFASQDGRDERPLEGPASRRQDDESRQPNLREVKNAYQELERAAAHALEEEARGWGRSDTGATAGRERPGTQPADRTGTAMASPMRIDARGLAIAACPRGLLAGAPTEGSGGSRAAGSGMGERQGGDRARPDEDAGMGQDRSTRRTTGAGGRGEVVGFLLVCPHETAGTQQAGMRGTSDARGSRTMEAGATASRGTQASSFRGTSGPLAPGAYAVSCSGDSAWLSDESGSVVLRASLEEHGRKHAHGGGTDTGAEQRPPQGEEGASGVAMGSKDVCAEWPHVFGALAEEVMSSMGWAKEKGAGLTGTGR